MIKAWLIAGLALILPHFLAGPVHAEAGKRVALMLEHNSAAPYTNMLREGLARAGRDFGLAALSWPRTTTIRRKPFAGPRRKTIS